jgi:hypothetical protein
MGRFFCYQFLFSNSQFASKDLSNI